MPVSLRQLQQQRKTVSITYAGETFDVAYNPAAMTPKALDILTGESGDKHTIIRNLMLFLLDWDIVDEAGAKVPVSSEILEELPIDLLADISKALNNDIQPGEVKGATLKDGSFSPA